MQKPKYIQALKSLQTDLLIGFSAFAFWFVVYLPALIASQVRNHSPECTMVHRVGTLKKTKMAIYLKSDVHFVLATMYKPGLYSGPWNELIKFPEDAPVESFVCINRDKVVKILINKQEVFNAETQ